ncbi:Crp/Fnr family transcriptional regulator [Streptomyces sp. BR123]|jgi:CRP-like cAMP-binding protein|nr:Crp/Fnr family transcriptional regulator [Streptomyces sp. BR123]
MTDEEREREREWERHGAGDAPQPPDGWGWTAASLLGGLPGDARGRLLTLGTRVQYPPGRVLIRESDITTSVRILLDGVVKVTGRAQDGRDALLAVRMGGDLVGELAALDGQPRSATVTACGAVNARTVPRAQFLDCLRRDPVIALAVNTSVVSKLRVANARRMDLTGCDAATRLARVLHHIAESYGERSGRRAVIRWPITQPELATLAGTAEPTVHKALRGLREAGIVSTGYRSITVEDLDRLSALAHSDS